MVIITAPLYASRRVEGQKHSPNRILEAFREQLADQQVDGGFAGLAAEAGHWYQSMQDDPAAFDYATQSEFRHALAVFDKMSMPGSV